MRHTNNDIRGFLYGFVRKDRSTAAAADVARETLDSARVPRMPSRRKVHNAQGPDGATARQRGVERSLPAT